MFCSKCGANIPDNAKFCPKCGTPITASDSTQQKESTRDSSQQSAQQSDKQSQALTEFQNQNKTNPYINQYQQTPKQSTYSSHSGIALALGLVGFFLALGGLGAHFLGIIALVLTIIGLVLASRARKANGPEGTSTGALVFGILGLIIAIIATIEFAACATCTAALCSSIL